MILHKIEEGIRHYFLTLLNNFRVIGFYIKIYCMDN